MFSLHLFCVGCNFVLLHGYQGKRTDCGCMFSPVMWVLGETSHHQACWQALLPTKTYQPSFFVCLLFSFILILRYGFTKFLNLAMDLLESVIQSHVVHLFPGGPSQLLMVGEL